MLSLVTLIPPIEAAALRGRILLLINKAPHSIVKALDGQGKAFSSIRCLFIASHPRYLISVSPYGDSLPRSFNLTSLF
jgi:hypothetical protein